MAQQIRLETLDTLRGMAAIGVLLFHLSIIGAPQLAPRGYLAVDFFFMLSGFVISLAYEGKLTRVGLARFALIRVVRMLPLSLFGLILGTSYFLLRFVTQKDTYYSLPDIAIGTAFNALLLPKPWISAAPTDTIFPTNTPLWSLSLELFINLVWALALPWLKTRFLVVFTAAAAGVLMLLVLFHGVADLGATWPTYTGGLLRASFGFGVGALIWRLHSASARTIGSPLARWIAMAALVIILMVPGRAPVFDIVAIMLVFPVILHMSARMGHQRDDPLGIFLGRISFALYTAHVPVLMFMVGIAKAAGLTAMPVALALIAIPLCSAVATVLAKYYDEPMRRMLTKRYVECFDRQRPGAAVRTHRGS
jgi:peptidoglycan/LPS O-acetylase OafA/YrhL